jgi:hypothetical protein
LQNETLYHAAFDDTHDINYISHFTVNTNILETLLCDPCATHAAAIAVNAHVKF